MVRGLDGSFLIPVSTVAACGFQGSSRRRPFSTSSGGYGVGETPLPIPNRAVKPHSADGTWPFGPGRVGRRRFNFERAAPRGGPFSFPRGCSAVTALVLVRVRPGWPSQPRQASSASGRRAAGPRNAALRVLRTPERADLRRRGHATGPARRRTARERDAVRMRRGSAARRGAGGPGAALGRVLAGLEHDRLECREGDGGAQGAVQERGASGG